MENGLRAGPVYWLTMQATGADQCDYATFVWRNRAPPRVQFFAWLLTRQRLNCRTNLRGKNLLDDTSCELCASGEEDCHHLILSCPFANQAWQALGMDATLGDVAKLWALPRPATIPTRHFDSFVLLICWNLWKHRNDVIFRSLPPPHTSDSGMPAGMRPVSGAGDGEGKIILCVMPGALCFLICKHRTTNILS